MTTEKQTCPRRAENGMDVEGPLRGSGPNKDTWDVREKDGLRKCSYCGSVHPEDFLAKLKEGVELGVTDKDYKAYLELTKGVNKFYYQHFSTEQRHEFIDMLNLHQVRLGFPGHFTVLPFFCRVAAE